MGRANKWLDELIPKVDYLPVKEAGEKIENGEWWIERREVKADPVADFRAALNGHNRYVPSGTYTGLLHNGAIIMSDTPDERNDHREAVRMAHKLGGHVLVNGLGLGLVVNAILLSDEVEKVTVIEIDKAVIELVAPHLLAKFGDRFEVIHADALEWKPAKGVSYSVVWHDIWPTLDTDNLSTSYAKLARKYGRRCAWQGAWGKEFLIRRRREEDNARPYWGW